MLFGLGIPALAGVSAVIMVLVVTVTVVLLMIIISSSMVCSAWSLVSAP
jgi:hypothetical protein